MNQEKYYNVIELSKHFVINILSNDGNSTSRGLAEILEIQSGNKDILLEHLKAIINIMVKAKDELENGDNNEFKR